MEPHSDTSEEQLTLQARMFRQMSAQERIAAVSAQTRFVVQLADADVRRRHPGWNDAQVRREAARRWLTPDEHARWVAAAGSPSA